MGAFTRGLFVAATVATLAGNAAGVESPATGGPVVATAEESASVAAIDVLESAPSAEEIRESRLARVVIRPSASGARTKPAPEISNAAASAQPVYISVPSNTLGDGEPLWSRRERESAEVRRVQAETAIVEREAARPSDSLGDCFDGVVVFGPRVPRWVGRNWYRPGLSIDTGERGLVRRIFGPGGEATVTIEPTDDVIDRAQLEFGRIARPNIGPIIEPQLEAQRKFGRNATPPIARIQRQTDEAQLRIRKQAPLPK